MATGTWRTLWMGEPYFRSLGIKNFMGISPERSRACPSAKPLETPNRAQKTRNSSPPESKCSFFHFVNKFPLPDPQDGRIKVLLL
jgi:hypothetical protein